VNDPASSQQISQIVALGQDLYNHLFQGNFRDSWHSAQAIAQHRRELLQLRLGLKGTLLPRLPWEILHAQDRPLATGKDVVFSRYQASLNTKLHPELVNLLKSAPVMAPCRILMAIATPTDQSDLQLEREYLQLQKELTSDKLNFAGQIHLDILRHPDREQLTQALEQGQYQVFHYAGHSQFGNTGSELCLVNARTGLTETLSGEDLAGLLVNNGVLMAVFNSCRGAYSHAEPLSDDKPSIFNSLAETVVSRGVPAVLAMAERIPDEVSLTLTRLFYRNLWQGYPIDLSLSRARQGLISAYGSHQLYWALPVLYLHPDFSGVLMASPIDHYPITKPPVPVLDKELSNLFQVETENALAKIQDLREVLQNPPVNSQENLQVNQPEKNTINLDHPANSQYQIPATVIANSIPKVVPNLHQHNLHQHKIREELSAKFLLNKLEQTTHLIDTVQKRIVGGLILVSLSIWGIWLWQKQQPVTNNLPPIPPDMIISSPIPQITNLSKATTNQVTAIAIENFSSNNFAQAEAAMGELLERGALPQAKAALTHVPSVMLDNPTINFLHGRLAWQFVQQGDRNYGVDDARRYWVAAVKGEPQSLKFLTALGAAYYGEENWQQAYITWRKVLELTAGANIKSQDDQSDQLFYRVNAEAGIALVLMQTANQLSPGEEQEKRLAQAQQLSQNVLSVAPLKFQLHELAQNWLWSEAMIADWQALLASRG
jgi:CHAT domain-containing protein